MPDPNNYIPDLVERYASDQEEQQVCECCGEWPCSMDRWENEGRE